ncbi:RNA dependent RNA polymerase family protein [Aphelenchoides avenae]|nr:RNA dependent RNA polymerase family protein [Aphelenchus avenae]
MADIGRLKIVFKWVHYERLEEDVRKALLQEFGQHEFGDRVSAMFQDLHACFANYPGIDARHEPPQDLGHSEEENDPRREYTVFLAHDDLHEVFMPMVSTALKRIDEYGQLYSEFFSLKVGIVVLSTSFFTPEFLPADMMLKAQAVSFGNIVDFRTYNHHRYMRPWRQVFQAHCFLRLVPCENSGKNLQIMQRYYGSPQSHALLVDLVSMRWNFSDNNRLQEHDQRRMIVRFPYLVEEPAKGIRKSRFIDSVVKLEMRYASIRRVLLDVVPHQNGNYRAALFFHVAYPPAIRVVKMFDDSKNGCFLGMQGDRFKSWDANKREPDLKAEVHESPVFVVNFQSLEPYQISNILGRLRNCVSHMEFRKFNACSVPFASFVASPLRDDECRRLLVDPEEYARTQALMSRGAVFKDYILKDAQSRHAFVKQVAVDYFNDRILTTKVLECLLAQLDDDPEPGHPMELYQRIRRLQVHNAEHLKQLYNDDIKKGFVRIRKVMITPTRILFVAPELLMANRVLRLDPEKWPTDRFLRVIFRDDNGCQVHVQQVGERLIDYFMKDKLDRGITVAERHFNYLASSNSQMRDSGCYFAGATHEEIVELRTSLGSFKIASVPKMMARLGQCFTQAQEVEVEFEREEYADGYDFEGGANSKGEPYTYSDGVGRMSYEIASKVAAGLELKSCVPSCFQIRFRGYKGVLSVSPHMDALAKWGRANGVTDQFKVKKRDGWLNLHFYYRPSQKKFDAQRAKKLEIVKFSAPTSLCLNRPFINILDQVSELQSREVHSRLCKRIHWLLDIYLLNMMRSLTDEQQARGRLAEFPKLILYELLKDVNLTQEPFFRSLLRGAARASLRRVRTKLQIPIPTHLGRAFFGIVDETGELQHGQVFVQYTRNVSSKLPGSSAERIVHVGPVLITKNPSVVQGDVRMLEAVDIPALRNTCNDVLVFPRYGPRPHSDEMAGSDLDGDEYTVIWDPEFFLLRSEQAFDYTSIHEEVKAEDEEEFRAKMTTFFVDYVKQDSVGRLANAFLINSDLYGITSEVCSRIAKKHMLALDFPKTGVAPPPLSKKWDDEVPPERTERVPDYMEKDHEPSYISRRLNGQLFRRAKEIDDILSLATKEEQSTKVPFDELLTVQRAIPDKFMRLAQEHYAIYAANIQSLVDTYGIRDEGELFSGCYMSLKNRLSERDNDDMSFFNTQRAIEQRLMTTFANCRRNFFEAFDDKMEDITTPEKRHTFGDVKDVFQRVCHDPSENHQLLASAYYRTAYDSGAGRFLSFAWLAWDVLNTIRKANLVTLSASGQRAFSFNPLSDKLSAHMDEYTKDGSRAKKLHKFVKKMTARETCSAQEQIVYRTMKRYVDRHAGTSELIQYDAKSYGNLGLDELMFFSMRWAQKRRIYEGPMKDTHVCLLLLLFGLNRLPCESVAPPKPFLDEIRDDDSQNAMERIDLKKQSGGLGQKFLHFLEFLASRQFEQLPYLRFVGVGCPGFFQNKEWQQLHKEAVETYHRVVYTGRFDILPCTERQLDDMGGPDDVMPLVEGEPFVIEVPTEHLRLLQANEVIERLQEQTGCWHICFRAQAGYKDAPTRRVIVTMSGTLTAINNLKRALIVTPQFTSGTDCKAAAKQLAYEAIEKILG